MSLVDKEKQAIKFIKNIPKENTQIAFSGGKDSIVLYHLCKDAGVDFPIIYGNTTIDPVGTKKLIREHYSDVVILNPEKSFFTYLCGVNTLYKILKQKPTAPPAYLLRYSQQGVFFFTPP